MTGPLYRLGQLCVRFRFVVLAAWAVAAAVLIVLAMSAGEDTNDNLVLPGTDSQKATDLLTAKFPEQANGTNPVSFSAPGGRKLTEQKFEQAINKTVQDYAKDPGVLSAVGPFQKQGKAQISKDGQVGFIALILRASPTDLSIEEANHLVDLQQPLTDAGLDSAIGGYVGQKVSRSSTHTSEVVGILAAIIILLFTFGTMVAMGVPILTAIGGLIIGTTVLTLLSHTVELPSAAPALATMIGLGVGIDYALFLVTRHRAQLEEGMEPHESVARATATSGGAIVFAGTTVIIALLSLWAAGIPLVTTLGYTSAIIVLIAVTAAVTLLPAILAVLGLRLNSLRIPGRHHEVDNRPHGWARWAGFVADNPVPCLLGGLAIMVVLAIPVFSLELGQQDNGALPTDTQARQSYDTMTEGFGPGSNGPILVSVGIGGNPSKTQANLKKLGSAIAGTADVESVTPPLVSNNGKAAVYTVTSKSAPSDPATTDLVKTLRDPVIPNAIKGTGLTADVGGTTAGYIDLASQISKRLPLVIAIVLGLSFIVLLLAFRSVLVPVKAVIMNVLSILAAFGVVTYVFDHTWTAKLIGLDETVPIVSYVPLMMFAILFGLSMDYEVFLMTHVRERWKSHQDPHEAIVHGLAITARVITSAALIMVSVFCAFVISDDPTIKQFGLGMAAAVAIDASVVRCLMVPAIMSLLGRAGWWMPDWLDSATPELSIEGDEFFAERDAAAGS